MITGAHTIIYAQDAEAARTFLSETLGLPGVDAGAGEIGLYQPQHPTAYDLP